MRKNYLLMSILASGALALTGCSNRDVYEGPVNEEKVYNDFNFSTVASSTPVKVSYNNMGIEASVYFEIYDVNPVTEGEYNYSKRSDVTPLFAAYTNDKGVFEGNVDLPAYINKVYVYTPAFYAQTLIEAEKSNGQFVAQDSEIVVEDESGEAKELTRTITQTGTTTYDSYMVSTASSVPNAYKNDTRWKTWLGEYDKYRNGAITDGSYTIGQGRNRQTINFTGYAYTGTELVPSNVADLYSAHSNVINTNNDCPVEYRSYSDLYVNEDAEVAVTFLGQNTCWNCSMGYYYYKEGEKPTSLNDANVIMLFPNTQDGLWSKDRTKASKTAGIDRGTTVQLYYYPNIAEGIQDGATTVFPAGYRIGLVIATNAWSNRVSGFSANTYYRSATSEGLSVDVNGNILNEPRTAAYKYGENIIISFEDYNTDKNFSDVVVTLNSNPVDAITDIPIVDPTSNKTTTEVLKGIYAFEDLWPTTGDYDMNDVMVKYKYGKTFDKNNKIYAETFTFQTFKNYATLTNGLAFRINGGTTPTSVKYEVSTDGTTFVETDNITHEDADNVYVLSSNVYAGNITAYRVTLNYENGITAESVANPFIWRAGTTEGKRWEVHIATEKPTSKVDESYFDQGDDATDKVKGIYYVRSGNYPFAFFLAGATETDLAPMLERSNESKPVSEMYSGYAEWVTSGGTKNTDWYKQQ